MRPFEHDDYETAIEEYPGYIGYTWDGEFRPGPELVALEGFDWKSYSDFVDEAGGDRTLAVTLGSQTISLKFEAYADMAYLLDQIPAIDVCKDDGPPDQGMASGSGFVFLLTDDFTYEELSEHVLALRQALDADLSRLSLPPA